MISLQNYTALQTLSTALTGSAGRAVKAALRAVTPAGDLLIDLDDALVGVEVTSYTPATPATADCPAEPDELIWEFTDPQTAALAYFLGAYENQELNEKVRRAYWEKLNDD